MDRLNHLKTGNSNGCDDGVTMSAAAAAASGTTGPFVNVGGGGMGEGATRLSATAGEMGDVVGARGRRDDPAAMAMARGSLEDVRNRAILMLGIVKVDEGRGGFWKRDDMYCGE